MNDQAAMTLATRMAKAVFDQCSKGKKHRLVEAHLSEVQLATVLAVFGQEMWRHGYACGKGEKPTSPINEEGQLAGEKR